MATDSQDVLVALRRILNATELHVKETARATGLTPSQLVVLQTIQHLGSVPISWVAKEINLTQATVTTILDRLEEIGLVYRQRDLTDKRIVHALLTDEGTKVVDRAPVGLQRRFLEAFDALQAWERNWVLGALERVGEMMQVDSSDASPILDVGAVDRNPAEPSHPSGPSRRARSS